MPESIAPRGLSVTRAVPVTWFSNRNPGRIIGRLLRSVDELLRDADAALYEAKRRGKDQLVSAAGGSFPR